MSQFFQIHPDNPQKRLVNQAAEIILGGGVAVLPTDCAYVLCCQLENKQALERIQSIRRMDKKHNFTIMCRDLSELSNYAIVDNQQYRILKTYTPGAYTFILRATREVPKRLMHPKRKTIGIRVPDHKITQEVLEVVNEPIMSSTLIMPGEADPMTDPYDIRQLLEHQVDLVVDGGYCGMESTTVVEYTDGESSVIREGAGDPEPFK